MRLRKSGVIEDLETDAQGNASQKRCDNKMLLPVVMMLLKASMMLLKDYFVNNGLSEIEHGPFDIIGDVHGCYEELCELLSRLGYELNSI